jgi:hypothetical protein
MRMIVLCLLCLLPLAAAQNADAPHVSPNDLSLWAHHSDGDDETVGWMNADRGDPDSTDVAMGAAETGITARAWSLVLSPLTQGAVVLDGNVVMTAYLGGGSAQGFWTVSSELRVDGVAIATGGDEQIQLEEAGTGEYKMVTWTVAVATTIPAGAALEWFMDGSGVATAVFLGVAENRGKSNILLPVVSADVPATAPGVAFGNLTDPSFELSFNGSTIYQYNWTATADNWTLRLGGNVTNGTVVLRVVDGDNNTAYEATFSGTLNVTQTVRGTQGNWTFHVNATDALGDMQFSLSEQVPSMAPGGAGMEPEPEPNGNGTPAPTARDSPGLGAGILGVLGLLAIARRRRP